MQYNVEISQKLINCQLKSQSRAFILQGYPICDSYGSPPIIFSYPGFTQFDSHRLASFVCALGNQGSGCIIVGGECSGLIINKGIQNLQQLQIHQIGKQIKGSIKQIVGVDTIHIKIDAVQFYTQQQFSKGGKNTSECIRIKISSSNKMFYSIKLKERRDMRLCSYIRIQSKPFELISIFNQQIYDQCIKNFHRCSRLDKQYQIQKIEGFKIDYWSFLCSGYRDQRIINTNIQRVCRQFEEMKLTQHFKININQKVRSIIIIKVADLQLLRQCSKLFEQNSIKFMKIPELEYLSLNNQNKYEYLFFYICNTLAKDIQRLLENCQLSKKKEFFKARCLQFGSKMIVKINKNQYYQIKRFVRNNFGVLSQIWNIDDLYTSNFQVELEILLAKQSIGVVLCSYSVLFFGKIQTNSIEFI